MRTVQTLTIRDDIKSRAKVVFLAKHASSHGIPSAEDGNHAVYHHEMLTTLRKIGLAVTPATTFAELWDASDIDFLIPLLNRAGFLNSEMLAPLMATCKRIPFLGASPIVRGLADDKHLSRCVAQARGVPTARGVAIRRGGMRGEAPFAARRYVIKPNASSASWGVSFADDWRTALVRADGIMASGHDVLIEEWLPLYDLAVPVIGGRDGRPQLLPPMLFCDDDPRSFRSYEEKRGLSAGRHDEPLIPLGCNRTIERVEAMVAAMLPEFWPFDYGRFEFRYDPRDGGLSFMEVNLSCNLWSRKSISLAAGHAGVSHSELVETIVAHSMERQRLTLPIVAGIAA